MIDTQVAPTTPEQLLGPSAAPEFKAAPKETQAQSAETWKQTSEAEARDALASISGSAEELETAAERQVNLRNQIIINGGSVLTARHDALRADALSN